MRPPILPSRSVRAAVLFLLPFGLLSCEAESSGHGEEATDADSFNKETAPWRDVEVRCGDGRIDWGEECDGDVLADETCTSLGLVAGELRCNVECRFDVSSCEGTGSCGDGLVNRGEECEYVRSGPEPGLRCTGGVSCALDETDGCGTSCTLESASVCGDGVAVAPFEECDTDDFFRFYPAPGYLDSVDLTVYEDGTVRCNETCAVDVSEARPATCGNGIVEAGETCDGSNTRDTVTFRSWTCANSCTEIVPLGFCGDGIVQANEDCDDGTFAGATPTCRELGLDSDEPVRCNDARCTIDIRHCPQPVDVEDAGELEEVPDAVDAALPTDASTPEEDAGQAPEAGPPAPPVEPSEPDAAIVDTGSSNGADIQNDATEDENVGCGARPARSTDGIAWLAGVVVAGVAARRRRRG